ncbi:hypothetical protein BD413DRAFT_610267 [Trametes elegans]|nr:hypothetical protein BD413DRAFT_610267 [Trametes elegans]
MLFVPASALIALLFSSAVSASAVPRAPSAPFEPSHSWVLKNGAENGASHLGARRDGCPVAGWAPCSPLTCYPLVGAQCCSDGDDFCLAGTVCQSGGCCPIGRICSGRAPPPSTVGDGDGPTEAQTLFSTSTSTRTATGPGTLTATSITTATRMSTTPTGVTTGTSASDPFTDPLGLDPFSSTGTSSRFLAGTDGSDAASGARTTSPSVQFPNDAVSVGANVWLTGIVGLVAVVVL